MPSTFLRNAVDMENKGHTDIVASVPDALATTANYLRKTGWDPATTWGYEVKLPSGYAGPSGRKNRHPVALWTQKGLTKTDGAPLTGPEAGLLLPAGPAGPAFLVTRNFDAVYGYNAAETYALAICSLADRIAGREQCRIRGVDLADRVTSPQLHREQLIAGDELQDRIAEPLERRHRIPPRDIDRLTQKAEVIGLEHRGPFGSAIRLDHADVVEEQEALDVAHVAAV